MKKLDILEGILRHTIDDCLIDYQIRFDVTGRIYEVKPLIYELPENGQRIMLGGDLEEAKFKIERFKNLIPIILPFGIVHQDTFFKELLNTFYQQVNQYIEEHQINKEKLYEYAVPESLEYAILSSKQCPSLYSSGFNETWNKTMEVIKNRNGKIGSLDLGVISMFNPQFGFKIISSIIPFINNPNKKGNAYYELHKFKDEFCLNYLVSALNTCQDGQVLNGIFKALARQDIKDEAIQMRLINIYNSNIKLSDSAKVNLLFLLKYFPNEKTIAIGEKLLKAYKNSLSPSAAGILLSVGYPSEKIANFILPKLYKADPIESATAFQIFSTTAKLSKYLPSSKDFIQLIVDTLTVDKMDNTSCVQYIIQQIRDDQTAYHIAAHLSNQNTDVLECIIRLIGQFIYKPGFDSQAFTSDEAKKRYKELLNIKNRKVVESTIRLIERIGTEENDQELLVLSARSYQP